MVEIKKSLKLLLLINAIVGFVFAFLYLVIPHIYLSLTQWPFYDPYYSWAFGGTLLTLSFFTLLAIKRKEWVKIDIFLELIIAWQLTILILNVICLILIPAPIISLINTWVNNLILIVLIIANLFFYIKQQKI